MIHDNNALCVGLIGGDYGEVLALHAQQTLEIKSRIRHNYDLQSQITPMYKNIHPKHDDIDVSILRVNRRG